jgi:hypothetical protein
VRLAKSKIQTSFSRPANQELFRRVSRRTAFAHLEALEGSPIQRWLAGILGAFHAANGLAMLCAGSTWWTRVPGAAETGPFNPHLDRMSVRRFSPPDWR